MIPFITVATILLLLVLSYRIGEFIDLFDHSDPLTDRAFGTLLTMIGLIAKLIFFGLLYFVLSSLYLFLLS